MLSCKTAIYLLLPRLRRKPIKCGPKVRSKKWELVDRRDGRIDPVVTEQKWREKRGSFLMMTHLIPSYIAMLRRLRAWVRLSKVPLSDVKLNLCFPILSKQLTRGTLLLLYLDRQHDLVVLSPGGTCRQRFLGGFFFAEVYKNTFLSKGKIQT